jgi:uncharacterized protein (DUF2336 family)
MSNSRNKLESLVQLAHETSSERRRELLREITDVFLDNPSSYNSTESQYFGEIMGKVAYDLERQVREELARKLAAEAAAPPDLIKRLAGDEIEVARPVITESPVLQEHDLIEIAERQGQEHLIAMTERPDIGERLSDVLVDKGDDRVVEGLVRNESAKIARNTMEKVVARSETSAALQEPLVDRPDLPADLMRDMLAFVTEDIKSKILEQTNMVNSEKLDELLDDVGTKLGRQSGLRRGGKSKPEVLIQELLAKGELNEGKLVELARQRQVPELICGLAQLSELDIPTTRRAIMDRTGEGLAIVCKSCGFNQTTFSTLVNHVWPDSERSIEQSCTLIALYNQVTMETAQRVMRFWRVRQNADGKTQPGAAAG